MRALLLLLSLALIACTRTEDTVIVSGPASFVQATREAAMRCGVTTARVEFTGATGRMVAGSDTTFDALRWLDKSVFAHAVKGAGIEVRGGGPI